VHSPKPIIILQHITTSWTKATRGAEGREVRARLPRAYPLPSGIVLPPGSCLIHNVRRAERDLYVVSQEYRVTPELSPRMGAESERAVRLCEQDDVLTVSFACTSECGKPWRASPGAIELRRGDVGRVRFNGRFRSYEESWYEDKIVNVAYGCSYALGVFTESEPTATLDALVDLW
jgi:hypothetical protein